MISGLRKEIVVSVVLLIGAALMFAGFLLVKLAERELLDQQRRNLHELTDVIVLVFEQVPAGQVEEPFELQGWQSALSALEAHQDVIGWQLFDPRGLLRAKSHKETMAPFPERPVESLASRSGSETIVYTSEWNPFSPPSHHYIDLTRSFGPAGRLGAFQVRYSLASVAQRVKLAQRLVLAYVVLYGLVLSLFGIYLLNRNIVRPVRELQQATRAVAEGSLDPVPVPVGPGEIRDLAGSFNQMLAALGRSRAETESHIKTLEQTNLALEQARDEVVRSEKLATVGHIAAGMAHEIGNPLAAVIGYLNVLQQDLADAGSRDLVARALAETQRIDLLVRELLDYAAPVAGEDEPFDPVDLLDEAVEMLQHQGLFDEVEIDHSSLRPNGCVAVNRGRLLQVFINLLINARDAMPSGGRIRLAADREQSGLAIRVGDEGEGIATRELARIFEPFYTTKDPGRGRGLGLAVCQRIVEEVGGRIRVESTIGHGSTFTVWLPIVREEQG